MGGSFLYYADRFKLYSAFCASHTKVPKVLVKGKNRVLDKQTWACRERDVTATCRLGWLKFLCMVRGGHCAPSLGGGMGPHVGLVALQKPSVDLA